MRFAIAAALLLLFTRAPAQTTQPLQTRTYSTSGHPVESLLTPDGAYLLVAVQSQRGAGIDIFRTGPKLQKIAFQPIGTRAAGGLVFIPHSRMLAVGVANDGVAFLNLDDTLTGHAKPGLLTQGEKSGAGYLAAAPDGKFLFVANEYGEGGNVGVIALHPDAAGALHPETVAHIPTRRTTPGLTLSPDGTRLYVVSEAVSPEASARLSGHGNPDLERTGCVQGEGGRANPNGALFVIDTAKAEALTSSATEQEERATILAQLDAGCSPVREEVSLDGATLYVTARGDNKVLAFDRHLLETNPARAFLRAIPTAGESPVGLRLFDHGRSLLVANSNRFANGEGTATVLDPTTGALRQIIKTGKFPRNIAVSAEDTILYLTIFSGDELMVLTAKP